MKSKKKFLKLNFEIVHLTKSGANDWMKPMIKFEKQLNHVTNCRLTTSEWPKFFKKAIVSWHHIYSIRNQELKNVNRISSSGKSFKKNFRLCSKVDCGCQFASLIPLGNGFWRIRLWNVTIRSIIILIVSWGFYSANWVCDSPRDHGQKVQGYFLWHRLG